MTATEPTDRLRAFEVLYSVDSMRSTDPDVSDLTGRARSMVAGVLEHRHAIDITIDGSAIGWTVSRMPLVDRNVLRLAAWELMYTTLKPAIVIDEAVELAKQYSTAGSGRFVNGVLDALATTVRSEGWVEPEVPEVEPADTDRDDPPNESSTPRAPSI